MSREQRTAKNESLFREVNERIGEAAQRTAAIATDADFVCECALLACTERITLGLDEYEWVRSEPRRFILVAGHEQAGVEQIVTRRNGYVIVDKVGEAGEEAENQEPAYAPPTIGAWRQPSTRRFRSSRATARRAGISAQS